VTDKVKLPPEQKLEGPDVVPPVNDPGEQGEGGSQVKVNPEAGIIVFDSVHVAELAAPAIVALQSVVVERLLKSALLLPLNPTWLVVEVALVAVQVPYTTCTTFEVS
jgi:hypothetical protein